MTLISGDQRAMKWIGTSGCYFMVLAHVLGADDVLLAAYHRAVEEKAMRADCYINDPEKVANILLEMNGDDRRVIYRGRDIDLIRYNHIFYITKWISKCDSSDAHFTFESQRLGEDFDPWGRDLSLMRKDSFRVFEILDT